MAQLVWFSRLWRHGSTPQPQDTWQAQELQQFARWWATGTADVNPN
jgi:hypothetical protein